MTRTWLAGLLRHRPGRLLLPAVGIAVTVGLLASLGVFLARAKQTMTQQAVRQVAVDWQVAVHNGTTPDRVLSALHADPATRSAVPVGYATVPSLHARTRTADGSTATQGTAAAKVLGLPPNYGATFPGELRALAGTTDPAAGAGSAPAGKVPALLAQQTASNLSAHLGDTVMVSRSGLPPLAVTVVGVVDLPQADSLFQNVGAPAGSQPSAPPDNVLLLGLDAWHQAFDRLPRAAAASAAIQVHVLRDHALPPDPVAAFTAVTGQARHLEAQLAGGATVGNNLGAALDAARSDALYAQVLFVFLGLPGALLAAALTITVAAAGAARRRREQSLLRLRGARPAQVLGTTAAEAAFVGVVGSAAGVGASLLVGRLAFGSASFGANIATAAGWMGALAVIGLALAAASILLPARQDLRQSTVLQSRQLVAPNARRTRRPLWARLWLDVLALVGAFLVFRITSRTGYSLVLAPEGVPTISVSYWAFTAPALLWLGVAGLTWRIVDLGLDRGRRGVALAVRPFAGRLSGVAAATARRQRRMLARASVLAGLAIAFAASTAVFNSTYRAQAEVDAQLTNGADVTVTEPPSAHATTADAARMAAVPGVSTVEPLQHRFAYIGSDLQDLFGVRPSTVLNTTRLQNSYFQGGSAAELIHRLGRQQDAILVSAETVKDYQLQPGDPLILRLRDQRTDQTVPVRFRYAGVAREFPTAPKDSFFVANADYVARSTGDGSVGTFLVNTRGDPQAVANRLRSTLGPGPQISDITTVRTAVGSSLTAVNLAGLTRVELAFALALAVAAGGLVLGLGLDERRRDLTVVTALGARSGQIAALVGVDALLVTAAGLIAGALAGAALAQTLIKVLTGVFDPAPESPSVPWVYLITIAVAALAGVITAAVTVGHRARQRLTSNLRQA